LRCFPFERLRNEGQFYTMEGFEINVRFLLNWMGK
jgi:hypothetical protein